jgi:general secretion pathway protein G
MVELLVAVTVLGILASAAVPLYSMTVRREKERELRRNLRAIRIAIDLFKAEYDKARGNARDAKAMFKERVTADRTGYPLTLDELVKTRTLRRVPRDPMNPQGTWIPRSYSDSPDSSISDSKDVFDVRSASTATAQDGTTYDTW